VEAFQNEEIALLQAGEWSAWLALLTEDVRYWIPVTRARERRADSVGGEGELAWIDDDYAALALRARRLESGFAVEEAVPPRTRYFVQNLRITPRPPDGHEVEVVSNLLVYRARLAKQEALFVGGREDVLRRVDGGWRLAWRKVVLDHGVMGPSNRFSTFF
jgi:3-phenylpropionate/cinnamic acid dioxygenase small subunit